MLEVKKAFGYMGDTEFVRVDDKLNAWVECGKDGKPIFDRGEVEVAKKFAEAFPHWEIRATIGPWRGYDITASAKKETKVILVDLYSVRPGVRYASELIESGKKKIAEWGMEP